MQDSRQLSSLVMQILTGKKETETVELKKGLAELKEGLISMTAILNKHGSGELWFGIKNDGTVAGLEVNEKTLRDLSQAIATHIEPKIFPQISVEDFQGRKCIRVSFSGKEAPYFGYGRVYMRVADEDRQLTIKELEHLFLKKNQDVLRWDSEPAHLRLEEIDPVTLKEFSEQAGLKRDSQSRSLEKLGLLKDGRLLNAAQVFFAKVPSLQLRCAVFGGTTSSTIIDRHDFEGNILTLIEEAQKYVLKNIHMGMQLRGLYREDVSEISVEALREAIINAFCHRDYRDPDHVQIAVFKDRVEIRSPGELFDGMTIARMRKGNVSRRRNPLIADLLRRIRMVEAWGRGLPLILEKEPNVDFKVSAKFFVAAFARPSFFEPKSPVLKKTPGKTPGITPGKTTGRILQLLRENPALSIPELTEIILVSESAVERAIRKLRVAGQIRRVGPHNGGRWEVLF